MATVIADSELKVKIHNALKEASVCMTRIEGEKESIKDIIADVAAEAGIDKKVVRKMIKVYHKQNYAEDVAEQDEFQLVYESVVK